MNFVFFFLCAFLVVLNKCLYNWRKECVVSSKNSFAYFLKCLTCHVDYENNRLGIVYIEYLVNLCWIGLIISHKTVSSDQYTLSCQAWLHGKHLQNPVKLNYRRWILSAVSREVWMKSDIGSRKTKLIEKDGHIGTCRKRWMYWKQRGKKRV